MKTKPLLLTLIAFSFLLQNCNKLAKCKRYLGDYDDSGQLLSVKYDGVNFSVVKASQVIPCTCTDEGTLILKDPTGPMMMEFTDSDSHKKICFEKDSVVQSCVSVK